MKKLIPLNLSSKNTSKNLDKKLDAILRAHTKALTTKRQTAIEELGEKWLGHVDGKKVRIARFPAPIVKRGE